MLLLMLLAQGDRMDRLEWLREAFAPGRSTMPGFATGFLVMVVIVGAFLFAGYAVKAVHEQRQLREGPLPFFVGVLRTCGVSRINRWLMARVARFGDVPHPGAMLLSSRLYDAQTSTWLMKACPALLRPWARRRLNGAVRRKLFTPTH